MFSFMASQAIALSQAKQRQQARLRASGQQSAAPRTGKGFFARLFDALVESRMRRAGIELQRHRGLRGESAQEMNTAETMPQCLARRAAGILEPPHFLVGRNRRGQWVVRDQRARCGGLFNSRAEALRFAFRERGEAPGAVVLVPDVLELFAAPINGAATPVGGSNEAGAAARANSAGGLIHDPSVCTRRHSDRACRRCPGRRPSHFNLSTTDR